MILCQLPFISILYYQNYFSMHVMLYSMFRHMGVGTMSTYTLLLANMIRHLCISNYLLVLFISLQRYVLLCSAGLNLSE